MKRILITVPIALLALASSVQSHPGRALGANPTPTVPAPPPPPGTFTPPPNPGVQVLKQMTAAIRAKGSYHVDGKGTRTLTDEKQAYVTKADTSPKSQRASTALTSQFTPLPGKSTKARSLTEVVIAVGNRQALRDNNGKWKCTSVAKTTGSPYDMVRIPAHPLTVAEMGTTKIGSATTMKILVTDAELATNGGKLFQQLTFYVDQSSHLLLRQTALRTQYAPNAAQKAPPVSAINETLNYSKYGESVKIQLPSSCH